MRCVWLAAVLLVWGGSALAATPSGSERQLLEPGLVNPGHQDHPDWFKPSFLDIREDVAEATDAGKRVILYFHQDGCPYCAKLLRENFSDREIVETTRAGFDVIAIDLWGDREVIGFLGEPTTEKQFAAGLRVQFTPTMLLLDEQGRVVLRINGYFPPDKFHTALQYVAAHREQQGERFQDFYLALNPKAASGDLHEEAGFMPKPLKLADNRNASQRPLLVMFEQPTCTACDELHQDILRREPVVYSLSNLDVAVVNSWSEEPVQTPDGRELSARAWTREIGIEYTPSLVFFDGDGREVFRTEGYLKGFHVHGALDYVATGAYNRQPNFQRFLQERRNVLEARGVRVDLMD